MLRLLVVLGIVASLLVVTASPSLANKMCADAHKDNVVNSIDGLLVLQYVADIYNPPGLIPVDMWDADGDKSITSIDAALVLQYDAGLIAFLPGCV
jgi:hypothetical protein